MRHIVYVDDDEEDRALFCEAIHDLYPDLRITDFESGYELISFLQQQEQKHQPPDAVISDMHMPLLNGVELLTILKSEQDWSAIPVAIFTTSSAPADDRNSMNRGAVGFFSKPSTFSELKLVIGQILACCLTAASGNRQASQKVR